MTTKSRRRPRKSPPPVTVESQSIDVAGLRERIGLNRRLFARLTGYSERALAAWEGGKQLSDQALPRMIEIKRLHAALSRVMKAEFVGTWLQTPNQAFEKLKPIEVVERGEIDRLWKMIHVLESGQAG